ncbi:Putative mRNA cleavage and polyadenylation specificity factor complex subunit Ysh1 [Rhizopus microsporus]|nr:Putative mRNA cleavage and polyadenylation specificity factor complex subunit Ysh1 [Rhizopus microsporus]
MDENDLLKITPLGAGNEVGRSSILMEYKGKTILLDAGIHPAYNGLASLPFFDEMDPASIDVLLVTQSCSFSTLFNGKDIVQGSCIYDTSN